MEGFEAVSGWTLQSMNLLILNPKKISFSKVNIRNNLAQYMYLKPQNGRTPMNNNIELILLRCPCYSKQSIDSNQSFKKIPVEFFTKAILKLVSSAKDAK